MNISESPHGQAPTFSAGGARRIVGATPTAGRIEVAGSEDADPLGLLFFFFGGGGGV